MIHTLRHYLAFFLPALFVPASIAQTGAPGDILEQTARELKRAGGIQAKFTLMTIKDGVTANVTDGTLWLKDEKFLLETDEMTTWFDGTTQWTYVPEHEEVHVSIPTEEELQSINPYALLKSYKKGYTLKKGSVATHKGKPIHHLVLHARKKEDISHFALYIDKTTYMPLHIVTEMRGGITSRVEIKEYITKMTIEDSLFTFDASKYPQVEIIE